MGSRCLMGVEFQFCMLKRILEMVVMIAQQCECKINDRFGIPNLVMQFQWKLIFHITSPHPPPIVLPNGLISSAAAPQYTLHSSYHMTVSRCGVAYHSHFLILHRALSSSLIPTFSVCGKLLLMSQNPSQVSSSLWSLLWLTSAEWITFSLYTSVASTTVFVSITLYNNNLFACLSPPLKQSASSGLAQLVIHLCISSS